MVNAIYSNARAKYQENFLLGKERLERIVDAESFSDALKILSEVNFAGGVYEVDGLDFESIISADQIKFFDFIKEACPSESLKEYLLIANDFHNAEAFVKEKHLGIKAEALVVSSALIDKNLLKDKIFSDNYKDLNAELSLAIRSVEEQLIAGNRSGAEISLIFKKNLYQALYNISLKEPLLKGIYSAKADGVNISLALRIRDFKLAKKQFVSGGEVQEKDLKILCEEAPEMLLEKAKNIKCKIQIKDAIEAFIKGEPLSLFEKACESYAVSVLKRDRYNQSGIIPFVSYCFYKLAEYRNLRIALSGIINGHDKADIKRRLRDCYEG